VASCVTPLTVIGFQGTSGNARVATSGVLVLNTSSCDLSAAPYVVMTGAEYSALTPLPRLTIAQVNELAAAVLLTWAVAYGVRLCYRFFKH
jgi:hypothetical protein